MEKQKMTEQEIKKTEVKGQAAENPETGSPDTEKQEVHAENNTGTQVWQTDDVRGKIYFDNPELCAQFLRDYSGLDILKNVQPEDIEDVKLRYHLFDEVEYNSDAVKRIRLKSAKVANITNTVNTANAPDSTNIPDAANTSDVGGQDMMYIVSLIDHKSDVDYNTAMQFLRYEVCIWADWEKEMRDRGLGKPGQKSFRYPPVLPIIYYEGSGTWTADLHLSGRIAMAEMFSEYIPDFTYRVVRNHDYSNDELMEHADEMSLLMMLGKIQQAGDIEALREIPPEQIDTIMRKASPAVVDILARTVWALCRKMNLPEREAENYVRDVREGKMGYLFENMEKMDIQEERRKTAEARKSLQEARKEAAEAWKDAAEARKDAAKAQEDAAKAQEDAAKAQEDAAKARQEANEAWKILIETCQQSGATKEFTIRKLCSGFSLSQAKAEEMVKNYWK